MKKLTKILRVVAVLVMSGSAFTMCNAKDIADIKAIFNPSSANQRLVGDYVATTDDVQCEISNSSDLSFSDGDVYIPAGTIFTITSKTFKNIIGIRLYFEEVEPQVVQIVSAEGIGFSSISELNDRMTNVESKNNVKYVRLYLSDPLVLLSEVQLEMLRDDVLLKIEVSLDVETDFCVKDGDTIYGDDPVPFVKKSNYMNYRYGIDIKNYNEPDEFYFVPKDGIKLSGQIKGEHTVFLDVDLGETVGKRALKTVTVNYDPVKPNGGSTTSIDSVVNEDESVYYDLTGHRVAPKSGQLLIRKIGSDSKLIRI